jgi:hypothetical protein
VAEPARWLVESAVSAIVEDGRIDWPPPDAPPPADHDVFTEAMSWLDVTPAFHRLLHGLAQDQVIVVRLPAEPHQARVSYDAPELRPRTAPRRPLSTLVSTRHVSVSYTTTIPAHLDSYHVTLQVPQQMAVRHMLMTSDADRRAVRALRDDAVYLVDGGAGTGAGTGAAPGTAADGAVAPTERLLAYEAASVAARMEALVLRRREDSVEYSRYLGDRGLDRGRPREGDPSAGTSVPDPRGLGDAPVRDRRADWAGRIADDIDHLHLDADLHVDNDPRESAGHVQWRRHGAGLGLGSYRSVTAHVFATLVDAPPSGAVRLLVALVANAVLVTVVFGLLLGGTRPDTERLGDAAEPLLTLLLLVPGLVIALISLQQRRRLRALVVIPQLSIGWPAITGNVVLAVIAVVSVGSEQTRPSAGLVLTVLALVVLQWVGVVLLLVVVVSGGIVDRRRVPPYAEVPAWLRPAARKRNRALVLAPTLSFDGRSREIVIAGDPGPGRAVPDARYLPRSTLVDVALRSSQYVGARFRVRHAGPAEGWVVPDGSGDVPLDEGFMTSIDHAQQWVTTERVHSGPSGTHYDDALVQSEPQDADGGGGGAWSGLVRTEPAFFFTFSDKLDLLLTVAEGPWAPLDRDHALADRVLGLTCDVLAAVADDPHYRPVTFIRAPSVGFRSLPGQLPHRHGGTQPDHVDPREEDPLLARGANVRITVGLDDRDDLSRQRLLATVVAIARAQGAALHVADRRFGPLTGRWVAVQEPAADVDGDPPTDAPRRGGAAGTDGGAGRDGLVQQVTVLGPARQGSFSAVLGRVRAAGFVVRAMTALSMQDVSFLLLVVDDAGAAGECSFEDLLARGPDPADADLGAAAGYRCLVSPHITLRPSPTDAGHAVWASWEVRNIEVAGSGPGGTPVRQVVLDGFRQMPGVADVQVEYHRTRRTSRTGVVERLKLAVVLDGEAPDVASRLDRLCADVYARVQAEERWARGHPPVGAEPDDDDVGRPLGSTRVARLRIEARERWLGTWIDDPR